MKKIIIFVLSIFLVSCSNSIKVSGLKYKVEGKDCFVYDLMELFRQPVTDRFTLQILNDGTLTPRDFTSDGETGCRLTEKAVPVWCAVYEDFMTTPSQDFEGKAPREWVREEIRTFAERQFGA